MIERLSWLRSNFMIPADHEDYVKNINVKPKVIYDIGSCTLHWHDMAKRIWPDAEIYVFDAMQGADEFYKSLNLNYFAGFLSDKDDDIVPFWSNKDHPAGNTAYRENPEFSSMGHLIYTEEHQSFKFTKSLDTIIDQKKWPLPDLIKLDVQGSELNVLKGAMKSLKYCKDILIEVQSKPYNIGAPLEDKITDFLEANNFKLIAARFSGSEIQGDAHYQRF